MSRCGTMRRRRSTRRCRSSPSSASAIDSAREAGVGHGALHPRDIFVTPDEARATGFGVVDALDRLGLRAPVRRPYSPPERIAGKSWSTPADVFSLGAIAFELLTGRRPAGLGDQMGSLAGASLGSSADRMRAVLARAMHEDPAQRFASAGALVAALQEAGALESGTVAVAAADPPALVVEVPVESAPVSALRPYTTMRRESNRSSEPIDAAVEAGAGPMLDDFSSEASALVSEESPREAARKAIAARKRQVKPKAPRSTAPQSSRAPRRPVPRRSSPILQFQRNMNRRSKRRPTRSPPRRRRFRHCRSLRSRLRMPSTPRPPTRS